MRQTMVRMKLQVLNPLYVRKMVELYWQQNTSLSISSVVGWWLLYVYMFFGFFFTISQKRKGMKYLFCCNPFVTGCNLQECLATALKQRRHIRTSLQWILLCRLLPVTQFRQINQSLSTASLSVGWKIIIDKHIIENRLSIRSFHPGSNLKNDQEVITKSLFLKLMKLSVIVIYKNFIIFGVIKMNKGIEAPFPIGSLLYKYSDQGDTLSWWFSSILLSLLKIVSNNIIYKIILIVPGLTLR